MRTPPVENQAIAIKVNPKHSSFHSRAIDLAGDRWTLFILQEIFGGCHRFSELHSHLGIATDILAGRLQSLVARDVLRKESYRDSLERRRDEYHLTEAGRDLIPLFLAFRDWDDKHSDVSTEDLGSIHHSDCEGVLALTIDCSCGRAVEEISLDQ